MDRRLKLIEFDNGPETTKCFVQNLNIESLYLDCPVYISEQPCDEAFLIQPKWKAHQSAVCDLQYESVIKSFNSSLWPNSNLSCFSQ